MRKKISFLLALSVILQTVVIFRAYAESITDLYADIYGITVEFDENISDIEGYKLYCNNEEVRTSSVIDGKKAIIIPEENLKTDTVYSLNIAGNTKEFKIKTLFFEDFNNKTDGAVTGVQSYTNEYGEYEVDAGSCGALYKSGELAITDGFFAVSALDSDIETDNVTFMADIKGYGKKYLNNSGKLSSANAGLVQIYMNTKTQSPDTRAQSYGFRLTNSKAYIGKSDLESNFTAADSNTYNTENTKYGFSVITDDSNEIADNYTFSEDSAKYTAAVRNNKNNIAGIVDSEIIASFEDSSYSDGMFMISGDNRTLAVIDNVCITYCTEDVVEPEEGEVKAVELSGDFNALYLAFDRTLHGTKDFSKIKVYENGNQVNADITISDKDSKMLEIIPEGYSSGNEYSIEVEEGFGTKLMWTYENYSFNIFIEPMELNVSDAVMDMHNITLAFNADMSSLLNTDKIKIFENGVQIGADIKAEGKTVVIIPENYILGNEYKVVLEEGFGDKNIYLFKEYVFSKVLEKKDLIAEEITGGKGNISVKFNESVADIADFSKVHLLKDDVFLDISCSVKGNELQITADNFENDVLYDLYIEEGFENDNARLDKSLLKQVMLKTVIFEDFEGESIAPGLSVSGKTITDPEGNKKRILWNASVSVTDENIINSENVVLSYDYQLYNANLNNDDKKYNDPVPYSVWGYNLDKAAFENGYQFYLRSADAPLQILKNKTPTALTGNSYTAWKHGDAYYDKDTDTYTLYNAGDTFPKEVADKKGVSVSQRETPPVYSIEWVKQGASMYIYRDGQLIIKGEPTGENAFRTTGYLVIRSQITEMMVLDNIRVSMFTVLEDNKTSVGSLELKYDGALEEAEELQGSFVIKNYSSDNMPVKAAVVAYGDNNEMKAANILPISQIKAGSSEKCSFSLDKLSGVKNVKLFLWDNLSNIAEYGCFDFKIPND